MKCGNFYFVREKILKTSQTFNKQRKGKGKFNSIDIFCWKKKTFNLNIVEYLFNRSDI